MIRQNMVNKLKILAAGDFHGNKDIVRKLSDKAKKEKVDLVILTGDIYGALEGDSKILEPFEKVNKKVVFIPGNWDSKEEHLRLRKRAKSIDNYYVTYKGVGIAGIGSEDWKMQLHQEDFDSIKRNFERMKTKKKILVSHLHARGTKAEFSGILGDEILRKAVEEFKPDLLISSHIHEGEGIEDRIGKTKVIQVGRIGKILKI